MHHGFPVGQHGPSELTILGALRLVLGAEKYFFIQTRAGLSLLPRSPFQDVEGVRRALFTIGIKRLLPRELAQGFQSGSLFVRVLTKHCLERSGIYMLPIPRRQHEIVFCLHEHIPEGARHRREMFSEQAGGGHHVADVVSQEDVFRRGRAQIGGALFFVWAVGFFVIISEERRVGGGGRSWW